MIALHGGPGAAGDVASLARGLAGKFRVLEPWQRPSGGASLTVATHVEDLRELVEGHERPALVGSSWGAMLALAFAAEYPDAAGPIVLIGCGTFDAASRAAFKAAFSQRKDSTGLTELLALYSYDLVEGQDGMEYDARANKETWNDMLRLQREGVYPASFSAIRSPVLMLHGSYDPHPGRMILESLRHYIPQIEYREWERCGHFPWRERLVRHEFYATLESWLLDRTQGPASSSPVL